MKFSFLFCLIFFTGCLEELKEMEEANQNAVPVIGKINDEVRELNETEIDLAISFCDALREKEDTFPRQYTGATISFKVKRRDCSEDKAELKTATIKARLGSDMRSGNLTFFPMDYYLPLMTSLETVNNGHFSTFCPRLLLGEQSTNATIDLDDEQVQLYRFIKTSERTVMAQILQSDEELGEIHKIKELVVQIKAEEGKPVGIVTRNIELVRCGNQSGNETAFFWSQEI